MSAVKAMGKNNPLAIQFAPPETFSEFKVEVQGGKLNMYYFLCVYSEGSTLYHLKQMDTLDIFILHFDRREIIFVTSCWLLLYHNSILKRV